MRAFLPRTVALWLLLCLTGHAQALVIYSGVLDAPGPVLDIDIDGDGGVDFAAGWMQRAVGSNGYFSSVYGPRYSVNMAYLAERRSPSSSYPAAYAALLPGAQIGPPGAPDLMWTGLSFDGMFWATRNSSLEPTVYSGAWSDVSRRFLGFRLDIGGLAHYGWMRFSTGGDGRVLLHDYAYAGTPGAVIGAGVVASPASLSLLALGLSLLLRASRRLRVARVARGVE